MTAREDDIVATFVTMSCTLAQGHDVDELLTELATDCSRLLDVSAVGLLLGDARGALRVVATSSERVAHLEAFQSQMAQGPCHTCYVTGQPVNVPDLAAVAATWPDFAVVAAQAGVLSVHAVPMRLRHEIIGAMNLFGTTTGVLDEKDLRLAQALADVATVALVQDRAATDKNAVNEHLQKALDSRVILEQAKGVLAASGEVDMVAAFAALRTFARDRNLKIADLASALVNRKLNARIVLNHHRTRDATVARASAPRPAGPHVA